MGMLFQFGALFTDMSVYENVAFPLREHAELPEDLEHDLVMLKLQAVGLRGAAHLMPTELSGGMARRVALARSIALDPQLILYDEPFTGLDPISFGVIVRLIREPQRLARRDLDHRHARRAGGARRGRLRVLHGRRAR